MLERHHLAILRAVLTHGTLTRAAEALHLTQSALSHTMRRLEDQLGTSLWHKQGRSIRLTQAGEYLHRLSVSLLPQFEQAEAQLAHFAAGQQGFLRIGMECHPCYRWLVEVIAPYLERFPKVDIDVKQQFQFKGVAALYAYEVDILLTPDPVLGQGLCFEPIFAFEQVLVVGKAHHLAGKSFVLPEELEYETLITYPVAPDRLDIFQQFLMPAKRAVAAHRMVETTEIIVHSVAAGRGVTALPKWLAEQWALQLPLACCSLGETGVHKHLFVGCREHERHISYIDGFFSLAREQGVV